MTRAELTTLRQALQALRDGNGYLCLAHLRRLEIDAEAEHEAEDRHNDWAELAQHPHQLAAE